MKAHPKYLTLHTKRRRDYLNITDEVARAVAESGLAEWLALVSAMHITASVYVNDAEDGLIADLDAWLDGLAPARPDYRHHQTGKDNADAHLKNLLLCIIKCCFRSHWISALGSRFITPSSMVSVASG